MAGRCGMEPCTFAQPGSLLQPRSSRCASGSSRYPLQHPAHRYRHETSGANADGLSRYVVGMISAFVAAKNTRRCSGCKVRSVLRGSEDAGQQALLDLLLTQAVAAKNQNSVIPFELATMLDQLTEIRVDGDTEDEFWVFHNVPHVGSYEILRKDTSLGEIMVAGFAAGTFVEFVLAFLLHPLDTVKTRLQAQPGRSFEQWPTFDHLYDGFLPVALTVPALSVFWGTKDAVRTSIIGLVQQALPWPTATDFVATVFASFVGETMYWAVKAPSQVLKTQQQAAALDLPDVGTSDVHVEPAEARSRHASFAEECMRAWPVLAIADAPLVALRTAFFVALRNSGLVHAGPGEDAFIFAVASMISAVLTTPLDVVRTQMLLNKSGIEEFPAVVESIYRKEGGRAFVAGWSPRLVWNGAIVGGILGLVRQSYSDVRASFLVNILDRIENVVSLPMLHR